MSRNYRQKSRTPGRAEQTRGQGSSDLRALDSYLERQNLKRHPTAKDGSCLFRAVAEQVFLTQVYHHKVRAQCACYIRDHKADFQNFVTLPFDEYLEKVRRELWGGEMELVALNKLYQRTIIVYMCNGDQFSNPKEFGPANGKNPIRLAYYDGNHYDSVYTKQHMENMSMCQGVLYTMLCEGVMKESLSVHCKELLDTITQEDIAFKKKELFTDKHLWHLVRSYSRDSLRGMSTKLHHNAALAAHRHERASLERSDRQVATGMQFQVGDRCRFRVPGGKTQDGEISALYSSENCHTVFVFSCSEEWEIPAKDIFPRYNNSGRRGQNNNAQLGGRPRNQSAGQDSRLEGQSHPQPQGVWSKTPANTRSNAKPTPEQKHQSNSKVAQSRGSGEKTSVQSEIASTAQHSTPTGQRPGNAQKNSTPLKPAGNKSSVINNPVSTPAQPVKVNGGPGGSLTSEDYSENSSSSDESAPANKPAHNKPQPPWHGEDNQGGVASHPPQNKGLATKPVVNGYPEPRGRESPPYLVPQLPRDASSQPEDDWPGFEGSQEGISPHGSSKILAALNNNPREPNMVAVTSAPPFGMPAQVFYLPQHPTTVPGPPVSYTRPANISPVYHGNHPMFPLTMSTPASQSYIVQRTPSNSQFNKPPPVEQPSPNTPAAPKPAFPLDPRPEIKDMVPDQKQGKPVYGKARMIPASVQAVPETAEAFTQYDDPLTVTMYTQTPHVEYASTGVDAVVETRSFQTQTRTPRTKNSIVQTDGWVMLVDEIEPDDLDDEPSPAHMISYGMQYAIKCLEAYADYSESERAYKILDTIKHFEENALDGFLERQEAPPMSLDSSQQNFLQSFAMPEFPGPINVRPPDMLTRRPGPSDSPPGNLPSPRAGYNEAGEHQLAMQPGFPMPMPPQPMMRPFMMMPVFPGYPMPPPFMMPPQMIQPNMSFQTPVLPGTPRSNIEEESGEAKPEEVEQPVFEAPRESSNELQTNLIAPSAFTVPSSALPQSSSEQQPPPDEPPAPIEQQLPSLDRRNSWDERMGATGGENSEPAQLEESQNLPNRPKPKQQYPRNNQMKPRQRKSFKQEYAQNDEASNQKKIGPVKQVRSDEPQFNERGSGRPRRPNNRSGRERQNSGNQGGRPFRPYHNNYRGRRQDPVQVSEGNGHRDDQTRAVLDNHSNTPVPCTAFQPRSFNNDFPTHHHTPLVDDSYPQPLPAQRWKFTELSPSDGMLGSQLKDQWPSWSPDGNHAYSETVEDPFPLVPTSQGCWDSDCGDLSISLSDNNGEVSAQCVAESSCSNKVECVVNIVSLPK